MMTLIIESLKPFKNCCLFRKSATMKKIILKSTVKILVIAANGIVPGLDHSWRIFFYGRVKL